MTLFLGGVTGPLFIGISVDAGYGYGVDAVVDMVSPLFLGILLLESPCLAEIVRGGALDGVCPVEYALEVETCIFAYDAYVHSLPVSEAVGNLRYGETVVFALQVVQLHSKVVTSCRGFVPLLFGGCVSCLFSLCADLFFQLFYPVEPVERFYVRHNIGVYGKFRGQFITFYIAVEAYLTQCFIPLRVVASARTWHSVFYFVERRSAYEVGYAYLFSGVETFVFLILPQPVFEYVGLGGLYVFAGSRYVLLPYHVGVLHVFGFAFALVLFDGATFVGGVEVTGELYVNLGFTVYLAFA